MAVLSACGTGSGDNDWRADAITVGFFTHDAEVELLAAQALVASGLSEIVIPWNSLDETERQALSPFPSNFFHSRDGRLVASRPLVYLLLSTLLYWLLGLWGFHLLPLMATAGTVLATGSLLRRLHPGGQGAPPRAGRALALSLLLVVGSPLLFYALVCWNMAVGACALTIALALCLANPPGRGRALASGVVLALGLTTRPELLLLTPLFAIWLGLQSGLRMVIAHLAGLLVALSILFGLNLLVTGSLLGPHVGGNQIPFASWLQSRPQVMHWLISVAPGPVIVQVISLVAAALAFFPGCATRLPSWTRLVGLLAFALCCLGFTVALFFQGDPLKALLASHSLMGACPVLLLALYFPLDEVRPIRALRYLALAALGILVFACPPQTAQAVHWGPRVLVALLPLLGVLTFYSVRAYLKTHPGLVVRTALVSVFLLTVADQVFSLHAANFKVDESRHFKQQVAQTGELPLLTDNWIVPLDLAPLYRTRILALVKSPEDVDRAVRLLSRRRSGAFVALGRADRPLLLLLNGLVAQGRLGVESQLDLDTRLFYLRKTRLITYRLSPPPAGVP